MLDSTPDLTEDPTIPVPNLETTAVPHLTTPLARDEVAALITERYRSVILAAARSNAPEAHRAP